MLFYYIVICNLYSSSSFIGNDAACSHFAKFVSMFFDGPFLFHFASMYHVNFWLLLICILLYCPISVSGNILTLVVSSNSFFECRVKKGYALSTRSYARSRKLWTTWELSPVKLMSHGHLLENYWQSLMYAWEVSRLYQTGFINWGMMNCNPGSLNWFMGMSTEFSLWWYI